jgi:hypothetical protein
MHQTGEITMSTIITVSVQKFDKRGDGQGIPVTIIQDQYKFDTDAQAYDYFSELDIWLTERPIPDPEIHPFPRTKKRDPMDIIPILDDMLTPECLHIQ